MKMNVSPTRFGTPGMGQGTEAVYNNVYGEGGTDFVRILRESPYEIAMLSRLIAHLERTRKGGD